ESTPPREWRGRRKTAGRRRPDGPAPSTWARCPKGYARRKRGDSTWSCQITENMSLFCLNRARGGLRGPQIRPQRDAQGDEVLNSAFRPTNVAGIAEFLNGKGRK